jgi:ABC-type dipeptide/oligopeptide/nickel transport system permease subunit
MNAKSLPVAVLVTAYAIAVIAPLATSNSFEVQLRDEPEARPSTRLPLGTDELGRDRWSRFVHGSRISLLLGPGAAVVSTLIALIAGIALAFVPAAIERVSLLLLDLFLALPWVFVLILARSLLPLNVAPEVSLATMFGLMSLLGWPGAARAVRAATIAIKNTEFYLQAVAFGCPRRRLLTVHILPNLRAVIAAKFLVAVPAFIIAEATLGMLGLGIAEPMPSWGTQLLELMSLRNIPHQPWLLFPAAAMVAVIWSMNQLAGLEES